MAKNESIFCILPDNMNAKQTFIMGAPNAGRTISVVSTKERSLKEAVNQASVRLSIGCNDVFRTLYSNEISRILYDKAIQDLRNFENEYGQYLKSVGLDPTNYIHR